MTSVNSRNPSSFCPSAPGSLVAPAQASAPRASKASELRKSPYTHPSQQPGERTLRIVALLTERYPCQAVPMGALKEIGEEVGVTREWVRQIANKYGFTGRIRAAELRAPKPACPKCGERPARPHVRGQLCSVCNWIEWPCANCGKPKKVRTQDIVSRFNRTDDAVKHSTRIFCNRHCMGQWLAANHGWSRYWERKKAAAS